MFSAAHSVSVSDPLLSNKRRKLLEKQLKKKKKLDDKATETPAPLQKTSNSTSNDKKAIVAAKSNKTNNKIKAERADTKSVVVSKRKEEDIEPKKEKSAADEEDYEDNDEADVEDIESLESLEVAQGAEATTFRALGIIEPLCQMCDQMGWTKPTPIQYESIPYSLQGRDIIGLAETGSGKTGAFAIPILQDLMTKPQGLFAVILSPTRELAIQISEDFEALGANIGVKTAVIVGGMDVMSQALVLAKKPHIIIGTPGRVLYHLENTKGFSLRSIKYLVLDEADRMLSMDFEEDITKILSVIPKNRNTYLFSATMTSKVAKLQRASLNNPVKVEVSAKYGTVKTLVQNYLFVPHKYKDCYLAYILNEFAGNLMIVFTSSRKNTQRVALLLRNLGFGTVPLHGSMAQPKRLGALNKFKAGERSILIATDVASRGLNIPNVDLVINFDMPANPKDYIHRVGRTARAGKAGRSITIVTQYDVEMFQKVEALTSKKMELYPTEEETVLLMLERVSEAQRLANLELKETGFEGKKREKDTGGDDNRDLEESALENLTKVNNKRRFNGKNSHNNKRPKGKGGK